MGSPKELCLPPRWTPSSQAWQDDFNFQIHFGRCIHPRNDLVILANYHIDTRVWEECNCTQF